MHYWACPINKQTVWALCVSHWVKKTQRSSLLNKYCIPTWLRGGLKHLGKNKTKRRASSAKRSTADTCVLILQVCREQLTYGSIMRAACPARQPALNSNIKKRSSRAILAAFISKEIRWCTPAMEGKLLCSGPTWGKDLKDHICNAPKLLDCWNLDQQVRTWCMFHSDWSPFFWMAPSLVCCTSETANWRQRKFCSMSFQLAPSHLNQDEASSRPGK